MNEQDIQSRLWGHYAGRGMSVCLPNSHVLGWEADFIAVSKADFIYEFEIKLTLSDFRADFEKEKHNQIKMWISGQRKYERNPWGDYKYTALVVRPPNYLYYVVPDKLNLTIPVPEYAGLIAVEEFGIETVKKAPRLHKEKISEAQRMQLLRSAVIRFWRIRHLLLAHNIPLNDNEGGL